MPKKSQNPFTMLLPKSQMPFHTAPAAPGSFYPAPKVTSAVIQLDVHTTPPVTPPNGDEAGLFRLIRAAFSQRRKTAANAVANGLGISKAKVNAALQAAGLDIRLRPEQLTLEDYCALQAALAAAE